MENNAIYLSSLGGSGENGRNCYLIENGEDIILLDCGVKREIIGETVGFYPDLTAEIVSRIRMVFLSHCHEDHVASLPLLYHLGYTGKVYGTAETVKETAGFMKKWMDFVAKNRGVLPFTQEDFEAVTFGTVALGGEQEVDGVRFTTGRSGHVLGGTWYLFNFEGKKVLYTGDMCLQPASMGVDIPETCDAAIMNGAYAGRVMHQDEQFRTLLSSVQETVSAGGKVMLPIPPKGRGIDIALFLDKHLQGGTIYLEEAVVTSMHALAQKTDWLQDGFTTDLSARVVVLNSDEARAEAVKAEGGAVYITPDGMITTDLSQRYLEALKGDAANKVIITGHAAQGTPGAGVLDEAYRAANGVQAAGEKIVFKVHMDDDDIHFLCKHTGAKQAILFHANRELTEGICTRMAGEGVNVTTLRYPEKLTV
ncbi:MAG: MBL fold metallo-hydrolase [Oscillospiraceae bacterium]|nr:MBL fold metallo-hydrolase [Oscillospiraceae bacterium]